MVYISHAVNGKANYRVDVEQTENKLNAHHHIEINQRYVISSKSTVPKSIQLSIVIQGNFIMSIFMQAMMKKWVHLDLYLIFSSQTFYDCVLHVHISICKILKLSQYFNAFDWETLKHLNVIQMCFFCFFLFS